LLISSNNIAQTRCSLGSSKVLSIWDQLHNQNITILIIFCSEYFKQRTDTHLCWFRWYRLV